MSLVPLVGEESIFHASDDAIVALMALSRADEGAEDGNIDREGAYNFEIERLKIWITQHDARTGRLDYKLREASGLREQVLRLLNKLSGITYKADTQASDTCTNIHCRSRNTTRRNREIGRCESSGR